MNSDQGWMSAAEASRALRVARSTLYAYVSRGFVRSESRPGPSRERRYSRDDVERLRQRSEGRRDPGKAAARALAWGLPVLESSITLIAENKVYYRGHDAVSLARDRSLAEVASLIWTGRFNRPHDAPPRLIARVPADGRLGFVPRAQSTLAVASARDPLAVDLRPGGVLLTGWRILHLLTDVATRSPTRGASVEERLARAWNVSARGVPILRGALILSADHELNVSSFTARSVASAGSNPYAVVIAGLAAIEGTRHGGASARIESLLNALRGARSIRGAIDARFRRGESVDGFGHPLYREGDPRAAALMQLVGERYPRSAELAFVKDVADAVQSTMREKPNIDFALAATARVLRLPAGSPLCLFALGRTIGWIGHAIEQYATGQIIRPRAKYVGVVPSAAGYT